MKHRWALGGILGRVCAGLLVALVVGGIVLVAFHRPGVRVVGVAENDPEMNAAMARAKDTVDYFAAQFQMRRDKTAPFTIKKPFPNRSGSVEHIWILVDRYANGVFYGSINNVPEDIEGIELGSRVDVRKDEITDWMFWTGERQVVGGFTVQVLYDRATPAERQSDFGGEMTFTAPP